MKETKSQTDEQKFVMKRGMYLMIHLQLQATKEEKLRRRYVWNYLHYMTSEMHKCNMSRNVEFQDNIKFKVLCSPSINYPSKHLYH